MSIIVLTIAAITQVALPSNVNPLAPAARGLLQCYRPNVALKTCQSIASYQPTKLGTYLNKAVIPVSNNITLETVTPVVIKGNAVCGMIRTKDLNTGKLRLNGQPMSAAEGKPILSQISRAMSPIANQEICTRYERANPDFLAKVRISGKDRPDQTVNVKWISPADGYIVTQ